MRRDRLFLFLSISILFVLVLLNSFSGLWLKKYFSGGGANNTDEIQKLLAENVELKSQLAAISQIKNSAYFSNSSVPGFVYSRYPFNLKSEFLVSAGKRDGVTNGDVVTFQGLFLGKISETYETSALVQTIFDSNFEIATRIGNGGADSLLKGGNEPQLTLIPKTSDIKDGDAVYSASEDLSYGLGIGEVLNYSISDSQPFGNALLKTGYSVSDVKVVEILKKK